MMDYAKQLMTLIDKKSGLITTKEVIDSAIPRQYLTRAVHNGQLRRVATGVYLKPDEWDDETYRLQVTYSKLIFSHETALFYHGYSDRDPLVLNITLPNNYHSKKLNHAGYRIFYANKTFYPLEITDVKNHFGRDIRCYGIERTLIDLLNPRYTMEIGVFLPALKQYMTEKERNLPKLRALAKQFNVYDRLKPYLEVLL
ncbi:MAG: type IV toxin-antitoxin system AbiEi family antitoxin domain-containing protein [Eubacterium sp.]